MVTQIQEFMVTGYRLITVGHGGCYGRSLQSGESFKGGFEFCMGETGIRLSEGKSKDE